MEHLFNCQDQHIADLAGSRLQVQTDENIGHHLADPGISIDSSGRYLGEIVYGNRLMYYNASCYKTTSSGIDGNCGNAGNYGNPGYHGSIGATGGYSNIEALWMR